MVKLFLQTPSIVRINLQYYIYGLPGVDMSSNLTVVDAETMKGIVLHQKIEERFALPVIIENDINAAVFGYKYTKIY